MDGLFLPHSLWSTDMLTFAQAFIITFCLIVIIACLIIERIALHHEANKLIAHIDQKAREYGYPPYDH